MWDPPPPPQGLGFLQSLSLNIHHPLLNKLVVIKDYESAFDAIAVCRYLK